MVKTIVYLARSTALPVRLLLDSVHLLHVLVLLPLIQSPRHVLVPQLRHS